MKKEIDEIRAALSERGVCDEKTEEALQTLEASLEEMDSHPAIAEVHGVIRETAASIREENPLSGKWGALRDRLHEWEEDHPRAVVVTGKVANAFAMVGL